VSEPKARDLADRFSRAAGLGQQIPPQDRPSGPGRGSAPKSKFTITFDRSDAEALDEFVLQARRRLGHKVDKSQIIRTLLALAYEDEMLARTVFDRLSQPSDSMPL
jgi:hypothetical protein